MMSAFDPARFFADLPVVASTAFAQLHTAAMGQELQVHWAALPSRGSI
jgi:hypothetical protein